MRARSERSNDRDQDDRHNEDAWRRSNQPGLSSVGHDIISMSGGTPLGPQDGAGAVRDLVLGSGLEFASRETRRLSGLTGSWSLFAAVDDKPRGALPLEAASVAAAQATPGPRETMSRRDRAAVQLLTRSPLWLRRAVSPRMVNRLDLTGRHGNSKLGWWL